MVEFQAADSRHPEGEICLKLGHHHHLTQGACSAVPRWRHAEALPGVMSKVCPALCPQEPHPHSTPTAFPFRYLADLCEMF